VTQRSLIVLQLPQKKILSALLNNVRMVIGNGFVANAFSHFSKYDNCLVFASGVSNSANKDERAFARERLLLRDTLKKIKAQTFVYFSTCSIYDLSLKDSPYVQHKLAMEELVASMHDRYHIFRVSNLAGKTNNPHTVLNFFVQHILSGELFYVWKNAARNIIDAEDAVSICKHLVKEGLYVNEIVNIANFYNYPILFLVDCIERMLSTKGNYEITDTRTASIPQIDTTVIKPFVEQLNISFEENYLQKVLCKYYTL
jgi:nucleoside-diphosphate-sugar epimerase